MAGCTVYLLSIFSHVCDLLLAKYILSPLANYSGCTVIDSIRDKFVRGSDFAVKKVKPAVVINLCLSLCYKMKSRQDFPYAKCLILIKPT